jgi:4a-hydroxytetrahydrobiopterin dehydratase
MPLLKDAEIQQEIEKLSGWTKQGKEITKTYEFKDFVQAIGFVNSVSSIAEQSNHHPNIDIRWNKVILTLSTHSEGGITEKDFSLARKIDAQIK